MRKQRLAVGVLATLLPLSLAACGTEPGTGARSGDGSGTVRPEPPVTDVRWSVDSLTVGGKKTAAPGDAHVEIDPQGKLTGNLGCNHFTADARIDGETITVGPGTTTAIGCEKDLQQFESDLVRAFSGTLEAAVTGQGGSKSKTLILTTREGDSISLSSQPPAPLTGTDWKVTGLISGAVATSLPAGARDKGRITFGEDGSVEGGLGCNSFRGKATVSGSSLTFGPLASTRKMCAGPEMELERAMLAVLEGKTAYEIRHRVLSVTAESGEGLTASAPEARETDKADGKTGEEAGEKRDSGR